MGREMSTVEGRFTVVDALRGIAALGVVVFHLTSAEHIPRLRAIMPNWLITTLGHGDLGVAVFFVLSGFVISHSLYSERITMRLCLRFMMRRSLRLDPPYWAAIAMMLGSAAISAVILPDRTSPDISWRQVVAHLFYVQDILGYPTINAIFWTLCLELQFYLIYVLLLAAACNNPTAPFQGRTTILFLFAATSISLLWPTGLVTDELWRGSFLPLWHGFLLGVGAYWSWRNPRLVPFFGVFALLIFLFSVVRGNAFSIACAATACLLWCCAMTGQISKRLNWSWLQSLGAVSYSLYLTHNPVTGPSFRVSYMLTGRTALSEGFGFIVALCACVAVAATMWWLIERPSMRLARKVKLRNPAHDQTTSLNPIYKQAP